MEQNNSVKVTAMPDGREFVADDPFELRRIGNAVLVVVFVAVSLFWAAREVGGDFGHVPSSRQSWDLAEWSYED